MTPRFAVYIAAHDKPALFADLVASLHHPQIDVYAHVDRAVDSRPFHEAVRAVLPEAVHPVRFVAERDRIRVNWGGISQVSASLRLLALSTGSGRVYHRHSLLSGTDLLLRPLPQLIDAWSGDVEFLRIDCALNSGPHRATVDRYHFPDHPSLRRLSGRIPRPPVERRLYRGSNWWSLTDEAIGIIARTLADDPGWLRDLRFASCPDEIVFHSILMGSARAPAIGQNYAECVHDNYRHPESDCVHSDVTIHGQHYIDWTDPAGVSPPDLDVEALRRALDGPALFARKVPSGWTWRTGPLPDGDTRDGDTTGRDTTGSDRPTRVRA
ncbi:MAG TPA: glycosyltransferase [Gordonia polyisoprenivorans]|nr:glycosyltransferase [Gordonia polyisoprenivorans]